MKSKQKSIDQLTSFRQRNKFSDRAWNMRGLNPSSSVISSKLTELFNHCTDALIEAVSNNASGKQLKATLKWHLVKFNKRDYDSEEREFICDLFCELAQVLKIDFSDNLNRWSYGLTLSTLLKLQAAFNPRKVLKTIKQTCSTCGGAIDTFIMRQEKGIPDYNWNIVQCKNCNDYSIVSYGTSVKEAKFGNYELIEQLPKEQFTKEQAEKRLEQIRQFRK